MARRRCVVKWYAGMEANPRFALKAKDVRKALGARKFQELRHYACRRGFTRHVSQAAYREFNFPLYAEKVSK